MQVRDPQISELDPGKQPKNMHAWLRQDVAKLGWVMPEALLKTGPQGRYLHGLPTDLRDHTQKKDLFQYAIPSLGQTLQGTLACNPSICETSREMLMPTNPAMQTL